MDHNTNYPKKYNDHNNEEEDGEETGTRKGID